MSDQPMNKYRAALSLLQRGRDQMVDSLAEEVLYQGDDLLEASWSLNEMLETQGTRLHFLGLLIQQLEQSAEQYEEAHPAPPPPKPVPVPAPQAKAKKPRTRTKKLPSKTSAEGKADES